MDEDIHSIELIRCLSAPQHTAYKTKRSFARRYGRQRERAIREDGRPPGALDLSGLLNVENKAAGFAHSRDTGRSVVSRRLFARCRSPPLLGFAFQISEERRKYLWVLIMRKADANSRMSG